MIEEHYGNTGRAIQVTEPRGIVAFRNCYQSRPYCSSRPIDTYSSLSHSVARRSM